MINDVVTNIRPLVKTAAHIADIYYTPGAYRITVVDRSCYAQTAKYHDGKQVYALRDDAPLDLGTQQV